MKDQLVNANPFDEFDPQTLSANQIKAIRATLDQVAPQLAQSLNLPLETFYPQWMKPASASATRPKTIAEIVANQPLVGSFDPNMGIQRPLQAKPSTPIQKVTSYVERQFDFKGLDRNYLKAADRAVFWGAASLIGYTIYKKMEAGE